MNALQEKVTAMLSKVIFAQDTFLIGAFTTESGKKIKAKGNMVAPQPGMKYELEGAKEFNQLYGETFVFSSYQSILPEDQDSIRSYLVESCESIGPVIAKRITDAFGDEALNICKTDPHRLATEIKGISFSKAEKIKESLLEKEQNEKMVIDLKKIAINTGIGNKKIMKIIFKWGKESLNKILENPYCLKDVEGIGFLQADSVARNIGFQAESHFRILAGLEHILEEQSYMGHTYQYRDALVEKAMALLSIGQDPIEKSLNLAIEMKKICFNPEIEERISLPRYLIMEEEIARKIKLLLFTNPKKEETGQVEIFDLAQDQQLAIGKCLSHSVFILTGAPGTGKTYTVKKILSLFYGQKIGLCAPTGKAAKRLMEMTGENASTIHRFLDGTFAAGEYSFRRCESNQLDHDVVIMDEASMVDTSIFHSLVMAIRPGSRLILVGDTNQLPSVGPGKILQDLIDSGVPCASLERIKRQDPGLIIKNCHQVKNGSMIEIDNRSEDFFFIERQEVGQISSEIVDLVAGGRLARKFRIDPLVDLQVLSPLKEKTDLSCKALNSILQERMNEDNRSEKRIWTGDKVIQVKNDYEIGLMNGDVGHVRFLSGNLLYVKFDQRELILKASSNDLELAYALTVHKYQGSEVPVVVIPIHRCLGPMITQRNWLYTAISRAKLACVLVGQPQEIEQIISRNRQIKRLTNLGYFLGPKC